MRVSSTPLGHGSPPWYKFEVLTSTPSRWICSAENTSNSTAFTVHIVWTKRASFLFPFFLFVFFFFFLGFPHASERKILKSAGFFCFFFGAPKHQNWVNVKTTQKNHPPKYPKKNESIK
jgi:hypothetical protein